MAPSLPSSVVLNETPAAISEIIDFWFASGMEKRWFVRDPAFDAEVSTRLAEWYEHAATGGLDDWHGTAAGCVALCVLLDQVPRNLFRGQGRAFATDAAARAVARHAVDRGLDQLLPQAKRLFLYLPYEHSESLIDQDASVRLIGQLGENPLWLDYARRHRDVIVRFGRFPHRNAALGRDSTAEETAFLATPGSSF
jgi:uncharacterized protein (DUF924 family)